MRASGEPYISHPIAVAEIVAGLELDTDSICAALLHDTVEDCSDKTNLHEIEKKFGTDVAMLVDGLTKIVTLRVEDKEEAHIENLRKMLLAMSKDVRVIFIKLCDRLHNMRTLDAKPESKRRLTALETMHVYAPLAHRLGMQRIKQELENLSLQYLDPIGYEEVCRHIEEKYGQNLNFIEKVRAAVDRKMRENNIHFTLEGRIKSVYSIYRKMYNQNKSFDQIYDFYALRIIVDTELECYTALGLIHEMFNSIPGRFKDYISTPKPNMYRSLHTTVIGRDGIPFEVQIRTWEMHHFAEYGMAAHWKYKSGVTTKEEMDKKLAWIASLIETEDGERDPEEFMNALKTDICHDEVFVFTPKGDVIALPNGANVIDFAYALFLMVKSMAVGSAAATSVIIDKAVGTGNRELARSYARSLQRVFVLVGIVSGAILFFIRIPVLGLYDLSAETRDMANTFLIILSVVCVGMSYQMPTNNGIIRGGGNPMFVVKMDLISIWLIVIPVSLFMAFVVKASPVVVVCCLNADQIFKVVPAFLEVRYGNWMRKLTRD